MEIFGFKSFADRSRIEFTPGISALLGPNGCGKSNVVDAIKWVLGEQASRSLRADKMEDVIFNGTEQRKALNVAEVALTISNEQNVLALDLPEITIKRRLYRSGESEYFINNTAVKLKDVRELFYDTGVGKSAYSVMEQGRIDQILSTKPEERRYLFEEAAGITKYKVRGQEAERKLEKTEENIRQIEGILNEVRRNHDSLKKQADKTYVYRDLRKDLFELEKNIQLLKLLSYQDQKDRFNQSLQKLTEERGRIQASLDETNKSMESSLTEVNSLENGLIELQKRLYGLDLEKNSFENQIRMQKDRHAQLQNQISLNESRAQTLREKLLQLQTEMSQRQLDRENLQQALKDCQINIVDFEKNIETSRLQIQENAKTIASCQDKIQNQEVRDRELQNELREVTDRLVYELDKNLKEQGVSWSDLPRLQDKISSHIQGIQIFLDGRQDFLKSIVASGEFPEKAPLIFAQKLIQDIQDIKDSTADLPQNWAHFQKAVPTFLNDFLSPQGILTQKRELERAMEDGRNQIGMWKSEITICTETNGSLNSKIEEYRTSLEELKLSQVRMNTQFTSVEEHIARLNKECGEQEVFIQDNDREKQGNLVRLETLNQELTQLAAKMETLVQQDSLLRSEVQTLEKTISDKNQSLLGKEHELKGQMGELAKLQSEIEKNQITLAQVNTEISSLFDHFKDKHSVELSQFAAEADKIHESEGHFREILANKREELKNLGQVNLMAIEEFKEVDERYTFLTQQLADLKKAREDLHVVTKEIRKESAQLFEKAFAEIKKNFNLIFRRLFGGGRAELRLTDGENILESGIEMLCQPPGKKLESINLLSGGEKSMTAVGLLFATFMVKPSPFCILDEIDAALDESNVGRFVSMLMEFAASSQFIVITHNKKTVTGASTMIGVTMESPGISKIIAVRLTGNTSEAAS